MAKCVYTGAETARTRADGAPALSEPALRRIFGRDKLRLEEIEEAGFGVFGPGERPKAAAPDRPARKAPRKGKARR